MWLINSLSSKQKVPTMHERSAEMRYWENHYDKVPADVLLKGAETTFQNITLRGYLGWNCLWRFSLSGHSIIRSNSRCIKVKFNQGEFCGFFFLGVWKFKGPEPGCFWALLLFSVGKIDRTQHLLQIHNSKRHYLVEGRQRQNMPFIYY